MLLTFNTAIENKVSCSKFYLFSIISIFTIFYILNFFIYFILILLACRRRNFCQWVLQSNSQTQTFSSGLVGQSKTSNSVNHRIAFFIIFRPIYFLFYFRSSEAANAPKPERPGNVNAAPVKLRETQRFALVWKSYTLTTF